MKSRVSIAGHPIHPIVIVIPLGLLPAAVLADLLYHTTGDDFWGRMAAWLIVGGVTGGVVAAATGFFDWIALPRGSRERRIGTAHMISNLVMLALFTVSGALRFSVTGMPGPLTTSLAVAGLALGVLGGWLGGELVYKHRVAVEESPQPDRG